MSQTFYLRNTVGPDYHHHATDMKTKCPTDLFYDFENAWGTFLFDICFNWTLFYSFFNASKEFAFFFINRVENPFRSPAPWSRRNQEYVVAVPHRKRPLHSKPPHQLEWQQWLLAGTIFRARISGSNTHAEQPAQRGYLNPKSSSSFSCILDRVPVGCAVLELPSPRGTSRTERTQAKY